MSRSRVGPATPGVTEIEVDGRISVYSPVTAEVLMLNETASDVWRLADGTLTLDGLVEALARSYGVQPAAIFDEVSATVARLRREQVLAQE
jgi:hypothetical protein